VDFEPRSNAGSKSRPDVIAYATNADGDLVPWLAVEIKNGPKIPAVALPGLLMARELLGTTDHYAVVNGEWYRADRSLRSFERVDGPAPPPHGVYGFVRDVSLATSMMVDRLWFEEDRARRAGSHTDLSPLVDVFAETSMPGIETASGEFVAVHPDILWQSRRQAITAFASRDSLGSGPAAPPAINNAIALLAGNRLGGIVLDPFCGTGGLLWAVMDHAVQLEGSIEFYGQDINARVADLTEAIARVAPLPTVIRTDDSLRSELPRSDVVASAPPFGLRLSEPYELLDGSETRDGDAAVIDCCLRQLRPGGRAALLVSAAITFKSSLEHYRRFIADEFRVGAVIGLPHGTLFQTGIRSVILVIDRSPAGVTFVAQLGDDWQTQLSLGGAVLNAARQHLDDFANGE